MTRPITPEELPERRREQIPDVVFEVINTLIVEKWEGHRAVLHQHDIVKRVCDESGMTASEIFDNHYLDVEYLYEDAGWFVRYEKPAYNETFKAFFEFTKKREQH